MTRVLITGITGFVGSHLSKMLKAQDVEVFGTTTGCSSLNLFHCDLSTGAGIDEAFARARPEVVFHCGGVSSVTHGSAIDYYTTNVLGTKALLNAASASSRRVRFVFLSTAGVYGNQSVEILTEDLSPNPSHDYGMSKFCAEQWVYNFVESVDFTIVRPFNIIGGGQKGNFVVPKLAAAFCRGERAIKLGNIDVYRDYISVNKFCDALIRISETPKAIGHVVNICSGKAVSLRQLIDTFQNIAGYEIEIEQSAEFIRKAEIWRLIGSRKKLDEIISHTMPDEPLEGTLRAIIDDSGLQKSPAKLLT